MTYKSSVYPSITHMMLDRGNARGYVYNSIGHPVSRVQVAVGSGGKTKVVLVLLVLSREKGNTFVIKGLCRD